MTTSTKTRAVSSVITFKGRGKVQREMAFMNIAPKSFAETTSRIDTINNLRLVLGSEPTETEVHAAQVEWVIGRVAARLPAGEVTKGLTDEADKLENARVLVCQYASPPVEGKKARKLRKDQIGRRTVGQHKVIRAAEEAWSLVKAELGLSAAQTQKERNAKKRKPHLNNGGPNAPAASAKPNATELVKAPAPVTADDYVAYILMQLSAVSGYDKKNAKVRPIEFGEIAGDIVLLLQKARKAANAYQVRKNEKK